MDEQFESLMQNPDIIIATPGILDVKCKIGRLMHLLLEVSDLSLKSVNTISFLAKYNFINQLFDS